MKIEILSSVMISGEPVEAGSFIEVSPADARLLIGMNKAQIAVEPDPQPEPEAPKRTRKSTPTSEAES
jgi:hypothetical protein